MVLIPYVLPGEQVRAETAKPPHGTLLEVLAPAPERVAPPCELFTICGGCHYQHAPYEYQLARKTEILREQLQRVGKLKYDGEIGVLSGPPLGYRNRAQFRILFEGGAGHIGYVAEGSHELVPVTGSCPVASPRVNDALEILRRRMRDPRFPRFVRSIEVFSNESQIQVNVLESDRPVARWFYEWCESVSDLDYATASDTFRVSPRSFFQVNRYLVDALAAEAVGERGGGSALDLYAGVGLFTLSLARRFRTVTAIEGGASAARDLTFNAERAGLRVDVRHARVEEHLARLDQAPDLVIADPPRSGMGKIVAGHLERLKPPSLTIVSCDPATLARDLALLPGYTIEKMTLADLFPQTYHLETVAHLRRR